MRSYAWEGETRSHRVGECAWGYPPRCSKASLGWGPWGCVGWVLMRCRVGLPYLLGFCGNDSMVLMLERPSFYSHTNTYWFSFKHVIITPKRPLRVN